MEAPDKIYVTSDENESFVFTRKRSDGEGAEYVRTDTFIEKACSWLRESITNNPKRNRIISKKGVITMGLLIEDFKKHMKGE